MREHMIARRQRMKQGHGGGRPATKSRGRMAAFQGTDSLFEHAAVWIVIARVHEPAGITAFNIAFERGGKINRGGHCARRWVDRVTSVYCQGFDFHVIES